MNLNELFFQHLIKFPPYVETLWKQLDTSLLIKGFLVISKVGQKLPWFGGSQCDKQNKQPTFLHKSILENYYIVKTMHAMENEI
jgi:hypothetical protein